MNKRVQIAVIGYAGLEEYPLNAPIPESAYRRAEELGRAFANENWTIITGGKSGVMEYASKGCKANGGLTVGVVCGKTRGTSNQYVDIEVVCNTYPAGEETTLISMADIVVVCGGGAGTLQEICIAYRLNKPIILIKGTGGWADKLKLEFMDEREKLALIRVDNPKQCLSECLRLINKNGRR